MLRLVSVTEDNWRGVLSEDRIYNLLEEYRSGEREQGGII